MNATTRVEHSAAALHLQVEQNRKAIVTRSVAHIAESDEWAGRASTPVTYRSTAALRSQIEKDTTSYAAAFHPQVKQDKKAPVTRSGAYVVENRHAVKKITTRLTRFSAALHARVQSEVKANITRSAAHIAENS